MQRQRNALMAALTVALTAALIAALLCGAALAQSALPTGAQRLAPERYRDVPERHWASDAITRLSTLGVLTGYPDQLFRGGQAATRYELAVVAARLVDLIGGSLASLALDPSFWSEVEEAAELLGRMRRAEQALENAPSVPRMEVLERRVADLEAFVNELLGEERFPLEAADQAVPATAAETVMPLPTEASEGAVTAAPGTRGAAAASAGRDAAQRRPLEWWLGIAAGYPVTATVHVGLRDLWPSLHLRGGAGYGDTGVFGLEAVALYQLPAAVDAPLLPYLGGGPLMRGGGGELAGGLLAVAGLEVPLGRDLRERGLLYLELGPEAIYRGGVDVGLTARMGLAYRF